jgi:hypothetical protein
LRNPYAKARADAWAEVAMVRSVRHDDHAGLEFLLTLPSQRRAP